MQRVNLVDLVVEACGKLPNARKVGKVGGSF
jgi:hypothetical protein